MSPNFLMYAIARLTTIPLELRSNIMFYAPLRDNLYFMGIEPASFSRGSGGYVMWRDGFVHLLNVNLPRFEYGSDNKNLGLLLEPGRVNYILYSENFTLQWGNSNMSVTPNDPEIWSPAGNFTASRLHANVGNATVGQVITNPLSSSPKVFSVYAAYRLGTGQVQLTLDNGATWTTVNLQAGWQRISTTQTAANPIVNIRLPTQGDEVWVWGAQLENNTSVRGSYIPTTGAAAGRNGDVLTFPLTNFLSDTNYTTIWLQDKVPKVNHVDGAPFDPTTGQWSLSVPSHLMELVKFNKHLSSNDIAIVQSALSEIVVAPPSIVAPTATVVPFRQVLTAGTLSTVITHGIGNANHKIYPSTSWITRVGWSNKTTTTVTLHFDTEVPGSGGIVEGTVEL